MAARSHTRSEWTPARDGQLRALWLDGQSASQIGERMGASRNSIIGRLGRIGLDNSSRGRPPAARAAEWTPDMVERLRAMRAEGIGGEQIGKILGVSKNAVAGKCDRLGIAFNMVALQAALRRGGKRSAAGQAVGAPMPPRPARVYEPDPATARHWMTRRWNECAFPVGVPGRPADQLSCCAPTGGARYCPYCAKNRMYQERRV